jgi:tetratricopeptide (TPR) repeat protein
MGNYLKAAQFLEEGAQKAPGNARVHLYQGMIADAQGEHDEALIHLNRALALDEDLTDAYKSRALIFVQLGDLVRADNDLSAAANLDASDGQIYSMRGQTRMARRLFEAAVEDFDKGLALLPGNVEILLWRATAFVHLHQMEAAFADLDTILEAQPDSPQALGLRGVVRYHLGETDQAKGDFARVVELDPDNPLLWNNRGFFLYKIGDYAEATRCFLRALTLRPGYDTAEYNLKLTRLRQGAATTGQASGNEATRSVGSGNEQSATGGNGP